MVISTKVKEKLIGGSINKKCSYTLLGEYGSDKKIRSHSTKKFYRGFEFNDISYYEGDCVLVKTGFSSADYIENCDIARITRIFDNGALKDSARAHVQWYTPIDRISRKHIKTLPDDIPDLDRDIEVAKDYWSINDEICVDSVINKCCVVEADASTDPQKVKRPKDVFGVLFVCRFKFQKERPCLRPLLQEDHFSQTKKRIVSPLNEDCETSRLRKNVERSKIKYDKENPTSTLKKVKAEGSESKKNILGSSNTLNRQAGMTNLLTTTNILSDDTVKKRVKRKLLDDEFEYQTVVKRARCSENLNELVVIGANSSSIKKNDIADANEKKLDSNAKTKAIKKIGKCRSLKTNEIYHLLSDDDDEPGDDKDDSSSEESNDEIVVKGLDKKGICKSPHKIKISASSREPTHTSEDNGLTFVDRPVRSTKPTIKMQELNMGNMQKKMKMDSLGKSKKGVNESPFNKNKANKIVDTNGNSDLDSEEVNLQREKIKALDAILEDRISPDKKLGIKLHRINNSSSKNNGSPAKKSITKITKNRVLSSPVPKSSSKSRKLLELDDSSDSDCPPTVRSASKKRRCPTPKSSSKPRIKVIESENSSDSDSSCDKVSKSNRKIKTRTPRSTLKHSKKLEMPDRKNPINECRTEFERARLKLHVSAVPNFLPCREDEFHQIYSFVEGKLLDGTGGCMYVSGVPGTGKTATVREVVKLLNESLEDSCISPFDFIEINAMKLTKPHQLWVQIWDKLTGQKCTAEHASNLLEKFITNDAPRKKSIFLLLDELDLLWTRKQDVMYNLFDWSSRIGSKLVVIAIANTMDLPERIMMSRVQSRLGLTRMTFHPYTFQQLQEIIQSRLRGINAFSHDAVQLVSRKVAAVSGDARRALDICRRATEISESDKTPRSPSKSPSKNSGLQVSMMHVSEAISEMFSSPKILAVKHCSFFEKMLLEAIKMEFERTGVEEALLIRAAGHMKEICYLEGNTPPNSSDLFRLLTSLSSQKLVLIDNFRADVYLKIRLNMSVDDIKYALGT